MTRPLDGIALPDLALAYALSQDFISLLTQRKAEELSDWFRRAKQSQIAELMSLAKSMQQDSSAIAAACSLPWAYFKKSFLKLPSGFGPMKPLHQKVGRTLRSAFSPPLLRAKCGVHEHIKRRS